MKHEKIGFLLIFIFAYLSAQVNQLEEISNIKELCSIDQSRVLEMINKWNAKNDRPQYFLKLRSLRKTVYILEIGSFDSRGYYVGAALNENGRLVKIEFLENGELKYNKVKRIKFDEWYKIIINSKNDFEKKDPEIMVVTIISETKPDTSFIRYGL